MGFSGINAFLELCLGWSMPRVASPRAAFPLQLLFLNFVSSMRETGLSYVYCMHLLHRYGYPHSTNE